MTDSLQHTICAHDLGKVYGAGQLGLCNVTLTTKRDSIVCVVGPNGAGKTTLMRILATHLRMTSGSVNILGWDLEANVRRIRDAIAVVPQDCQPDLDLSAFEHVHYYLRARGMNKPRAGLRTEQALRRMGLWDRRATPARLLSGGMRRRVLIAMCIGSDAELLLLDEPTTGLDPVSRRDTWNVLTELREGRTIVLTTHMMEEAEALADQVAILNNGQVVGSGTVQELKRRMPTAEKLQVGIAMDVKRLRPFGRVERCAGSYTVYPNTRDAIAQVVNLCVADGVAVSILPTGLEDVYLTLVNASLPCDV